MRCLGIGKDPSSVQSPKRYLEKSVLMRRRPLRWIVIVVSICLNSCGQRTTPSEPTPISIAGTWNGTVTLTSVTDAECFAQNFTNLIGVPVTMFPVQITQSLSRVSTTMPVLFTSFSCDYSGTLADNNLTLNAESCRSLSSFLCRDGRPRDVQFVDASINGTGTDRSLTATATEVWNVFVAGTSTNVGQMTLTSRLALSR